MLALYGLLMLVPGLAVSVRGLHDTDKPGAFVLLGVIPVVGGIILLVLALTEGTRGPNQYGPDPKAAGYGNGRPAYGGGPVDGGPAYGGPGYGGQPAGGYPAPGPRY